MTIAGFTLPALSAYDPPASGEGSLDPCGLAAFSDRLADRLVPGLRARMLRVRFVTAMAVSAVTCETLLDEHAADNISTPAICFEWLTVEAFTRRLSPAQMPPGVPGSGKARSVINRKQRLSAATYLKGPSVFGFHGVYKPFAVDAGVVDTGLEPGSDCTNLLRAWEVEQGFVGFTDGVPGSEGASFRGQVRDGVRSALREGRCVTSPGSWLFGRVASSLNPDQAGPKERSALRKLVIGADHEARAELARKLVAVDSDLTEAQALDQLRPTCSPSLGRIIDAVVAYETFAALVNASFRTLCSASHAMGAQPLMPQHVVAHETILRCARELPDRYRRAAECMTDISADQGFEDRLGEFAIQRTPTGLAELLMEHHERIQGSKTPEGKRPWFEPVRNGWVIRPPYGAAQQPPLDGSFVHPVRVAALRRFLDETEQ